MFAPAANFSWAIAERTIAAAAFGFAVSPKTTDTKKTRTTKTV